MKRISLTICTLFLVLFQGHAHGQRSEVVRQLKDISCGPRCVQYLIRHHLGRSEDLISLIREIQGDPVRDGCSLQDIKDALERRGIHTMPVSFPVGSPLSQKYPAVVHARQYHGSGHFFVWLGARENDLEDVWDGLRGHLSIPSHELWPACSGLALVTTMEPFEQPNQWKARAVAISTGIICSTTLVFLLKRTRLRTQPREKLADSLDGVTTSAIS